MKKIILYLFAVCITTISFQVVAKGQQTQPPMTTVQSHDSNDGAIDNKNYIYKKK